MSNELQHFYLKAINVGALIEHATKLGACLIEVSRLIGILATFSNVYFEKLCKPTTIDR